MTKEALKAACLATISQRASAEWWAADKLFEDTATPEAILAVVEELEAQLSEAQASPLSEEALDILRSENKQLRKANSDLASAAIVPDGMVIFSERELQDMKAQLAEMKRDHLNACKMGMDIAATRDALQSRLAEIEPALKIAFDALQDANYAMSRCKKNLDEPIKDGDPVHPESAKLTYTLSTVLTAIEAILNFNDRSYAAPVAAPANGKQDPDWYHSDGGRMADRTAWLIETHVGGRTHWLSSHKLGEPCPFTNDANTAIQFPTKESAEQILDALFLLPRKGTCLGYGRHEYKVTEHIFMGAVAAPVLTNEQIKDIELSLRKYYNADCYDLSLNEFARAIESAVRGKVAAPALTEAEIFDSWDHLRPLLHQDTTIEHAFYLGYRKGAVRGKV